MQSKQHAQANNKYMKDYDPKKPLQFITYLDMNNLYDWAMNGDLPYGGFKSLKNFDEFDVMSIGKERKIFRKFDKESKDLFLRLILSILKNYMHCTMIIC